MELRDALVRRPPTPGRRVAIGEAIQRIEELVDHGNDATAAVETLNETTGHSFSLDDFRYRCVAPDRYSGATMFGRMGRTHAAFPGPDDLRDLVARQYGTDRRLATPSRWSRTPACCGPWTPGPTRYWPVTATRASELVARTVEALLGVVLAEPSRR